MFPCCLVPRNAESRRRHSIDRPGEFCVYHLIAFCLCKREWRNKHMNNHQNLSIPRLSLAERLERRNASRKCGACNHDFSAKRLHVNDDDVDGKAAFSSPRNVPRFHISLPSFPESVPSFVPDKASRILESSDLSSYDPTLLSEKKKTPDIRRSSPTLTLLHFCCCWRG